MVAPCFFRERFSLTGRLGLIDAYRCSSSGAHAGWTKLGRPTRRLLR